MPLVPITCELINLASTSAVSLSLFSVTTLIWFPNWQIQTTFSADSLYIESSCSYQFFYSEICLIFFHSFSFASSSFQSHSIFPSAANKNACLHFCTYNTLCITVNSLSIGWVLNVSICMITFLFKYCYLSINFYLSLLPFQYIIFSSEFKLLNYCLWTALFTRIYNRYIDN